MTFASNHQLVTPPSSGKVSDKDSIHVNVEKVNIVNKYTKESAMFITSLWQTPILTTTSLFNTPVINSLDFERFLKEILKRSRCPLHILQVSMFYLSKLHNLIKNRIVNNVTYLNSPKKVFLVCLILAFKFNFDSGFTFKSWSKISGLSLQELRGLEMQVLKDLNYELNIATVAYNNWISNLQKALEKFNFLQSQSFKPQKRSIEDDIIVNTTQKRVKVCS